MDKRSKGNIGEDIACKFLQNKGFAVIARNYFRKWGELDIVAEKDKIIHFFEVKSVMGDMGQITNMHRPEDNVHSLKIRHIRRMVETYLQDEKGSLEIQFQFHVVCVYIDVLNRKARVKLIENVVL